MAEIGQGKVGMRPYRYKPKSRGFETFDYLVPIFRTYSNNTIMTRRKAHESPYLHFTVLFAASRPLQEAFGHERQHHGDEHCTVEELAQLGRDVGGGHKWNVAGKCNA